jgi:hypothetical protein
MHLHLPLPLPPLRIAGGRSGLHRAEVRVSMARFALVSIIYRAEQEQLKSQCCNLIG